MEISPKEKAMNDFKINVLPYTGDPRENFKATAVLNFWGIISFLEKQKDIESLILKSEFLDMPIAQYSEEWARKILLPPKK